jgi:hypothetical protein
VSLTMIRLALIRLAPSGPKLPRRLVRR